MKIEDIVAVANERNPRFAHWLSFILQWECVFDKNSNIRTENVSGDRGGLTFAGIDKRSHAGFDFENPKAVRVAEIYFDNYWVPASGPQLPFPVGEVVANFAVNMGVRVGTRLLQQALNTFPGPQLKEDGVIGPKTLTAVSLVPEDLLADRIEDEATKRYRSLVAANSGLKKFLRGWLNRNVALERWWQHPTV